ncbi:glycoside hydrolase family 15 protein [Streptomyces ipomoeae]|jgi:GH15 family glucan-1,4-alpha-glucosidase|uniref:Trehalase n=2 Tax=Streptomyces ipomoeae TaxID=103232 RepID=L1KTR9_9ACTN|nr:glycoside hydrolase family 15 protein [Streptomyces ipomoeae]EKX63944.1 glycosyl hydrolase, family 15 [Streptomyces ipomoeae 91-03]MDX2699739.1 glycoside hydrolase family 15 protein [Streptomyces ipomoeae]MDX2827189.1 glycoside hydrolase family 15 protein [Streptomyces ipomoeae]MDX2845436.1 glycoside hydrolase family 15 protein [Streptomyces ipomoeae]MDX2877596.1 glycoside hydrolase family 15 protein [Streptomyces ipomoeae]
MPGHPAPIEDYALIGDLLTAALVGRDGSVDWLCLPRFDSPACFAALLGDEDNGRWRIAPAAEDTPRARRRYRDDTLILDTEWETPTGQAVVTDFMPRREREDAPCVVRVVEGRSGTVDMRMELRLRFDYGRVLPWMRRQDGHLTGIAGPESVWLYTPARPVAHGTAHIADFKVTAGERIPFVLTWYPSHRPAPDPLDAFEALGATEAYWRRWLRRLSYEGPYREAVARSLITLKALTYEPTGGIVAAPTTSLPEDIGGVRNWDYRYCWLRDAGMTLEALLRSGFTEEAEAWRGWLERAVAGRPEDVQIMYGIAGERRLTEWEADWLPGYEGSRPVRIGNAAAVQRQLDVPGEVMDAIHLAIGCGLHTRPHLVELQAVLLDHLAQVWHQPDQSLWEMRGAPRHYTHSKVMCWVAFDRAVRLAEEHGRPGPVEKWREVRDRIHREICERAFDPQRGTFTQSYGSRELDAALLLIPQTGFLPPDDPRVLGTVDAVRRELLTDGLLSRYSTGRPDPPDAITGGEGAFLACSFWLADALLPTGREDEARELYERLLALRNDVGLLAEEYDPVARRQLGNFPQAFTHVPLIRVAYELDRHATHARRGRPQPAPRAKEG